MLTQFSLSPDAWPARPGRVPSIDGLRAASVLVVLVGHLLLPVSLVGISALGLKIFFFISGFLICRLLLAEQKEIGHIDLGAFYLRRLIRLYPVVLVYVGIASATVLLRGDALSGMDVASVFFYFVNYRVIYDLHTGGSYTIPVGMLWSLSIEEHFYLICPVVLIALRGNARRMLAVAGLICITSLTLRLIYAARQPEIVNTLELYWRSETRFDSIAFGVALACMAEMSTGRRIIGILSSRVGLVVGVLLLLASYGLRDLHFQSTWRFTLQGLALMPVVASVVFRQPAPWLNLLLNSRLAIWIGALSYSLYVWHGSVEFYFGAWLQGYPRFAVALINLLLAFLLAIPSFYLIERPVMRWYKRRRAAPRASALPSVGLNNG